MKRGRKRKAAAERLAETINIRFNGVVLSRLRMLARVKGMKVSRLVRTAAEELLK